MVTRSTREWSSQRDSSACSTRAVVDLPTATLPATPMTNGTGRSGFCWGSPRNSDVAANSPWRAATCRWISRASGR